ncbi:islet amyloid polypeptide [Rana temporaria]|uniref:islet amyloid polypeptide n=1 Tax=Rana temporaria TaxID=8407 RepID=UPI001AAC85DA|nr:islet amyloid polypeptide [Rana temporaria]
MPEVRNSQTPYWPDTNISFLRTSSEYHQQARRGETMKHLRLMALLIILSVTISISNAAPVVRWKNSDIANGTSESGWAIAVQTKHTLFTPTNGMSPLVTTREKRSQIEKRRCNTATCVTQRLADFLVRSNNHHDAIHSPTNVGSFTYGKRDVVGLLRRESFDYLQH